MVVFPVMQLSKLGENNTKYKFAISYDNWPCIWVDCVSLQFVAFGVLQLNIREW